MMCPEVSGSNFCSAPSLEIIVICSTFTVLSIWLNISNISLVPPSVLSIVQTIIPARGQMTPSM